MAALTLLSTSTKGSAGQSFCRSRSRGDDLGRMFQQKFQNLKRLLLELELHPLFAQLASLQVGFESAKTQHAIFSNLG